MTYASVCCPSQAKLLNHFLDFRPRRCNAAAGTAGGMSNSEKYRGYAEECMQLIERMPPDARPRLLRIAEAWLELARAELEAKPPGGQQR